MERYRDKTLSARERAADLLGRMSLDEKMAQLQCYMPRGEHTDDFGPAFPFGVGEVSCLEMRGLDTAEKAARLQRTLQRVVIGNSPHGIPAIFHIEGLCGLPVQGAVSFPCGLGRGASFDPELEEQIGRAVSGQAAALGATHVFAPVLDVSRNPRFGRHGESYGESPALVSALGAAYARGVHDKSGKRVNTESVAKHFVGSHDNQAGIHGSAAAIPPRALRETYARPFAAAIDEGGLRGVMPCYNAVDGVPVSGDEVMLTGLLRGELGFDGVTVSDYTAIENMVTIQKLCASRTDAGLMALRAGMDAELPAVACYNAELRDRFASGAADTALLDRAVRRVLETKFRMGLFESPYAPEGGAFDEAYRRPEDRALSRRSALESLVLLKNNGALPLTREPGRVAVIGWHAGTIRSMFGGYTHMSMAEGARGDVATMAGVEAEDTARRGEHPRYPGTFVTDEAPLRAGYEAIARAFYPQVKTLYEQLRETFPRSDVRYAYGYDYAGTDERGFAEALALVRESDLAILTLGGKHGTGFTCTTGENVEAADIGLPPAQEKFLRLARDVCPVLIGVHLDGRPISSDAADACLDAILEAWSPAEFGAEAICDVLTGVYNPSGRLPVTVARCAGQTPIHHDHENGSGYRRDTSNALPGYVTCPYTPRYPFGFGLSYTAFTYERLAVEKDAYKPGEDVAVTVRIANTGPCFGTETVQLYVQDVEASTVRPALELAGAKRVALAPGARAAVRFVFPVTQLALVGRDMRWRVEKGLVRVLAGPSSDTLPLTGSFAITEDRILPSGRHRGYYARAELV